MSARDDFELMQHADGELDERLDAGVRARIEASPDARAKHQALGQVTDVIRAHLESTAEAVAQSKFDAMWREIDKSIDRAGEISRPAASTSPGLWSRISAWLDRHRGHLVTGAVSAGAVAALALMLRPGTHETSLASPGGAIDVRPAALRAAPEIDSLDTPGGESTVINLEDEDGHTTVIWVTPADTVEGI